MEERTLIIYKILAQTLNVEINTIKPSDYLIDIYDGNDEFSSRTTWAIEMGLKNHFEFGDEIYDISKNLNEITVQNIIDFIRNCPLQKQTKAHVT